MKRVEIGNSILYHGCALETLPMLADGSIDNVISDFPYGITGKHWDTKPPLDLTWKLLETKSKDNANYVLFGCGKFSIDLINSKYDWYRYSLTWVKNNKTGWLNSGRMVHRNTEDIMIFGKPGHQKTAIFNVPEGYPHPCSALAFPHDRGNGQQGKNFHETQKPLLLMGYLLMLFSNENQLVLDPFMGSGTTILAAEKLGRRSIGIEREEKFFNIACQRVEEAVRRRNARYKPHISDSVEPNELVAADELVLEATKPEEQQDLVQFIPSGIWQGRNHS